MAEEESNSTSSRIPDASATTAADEDLGEEQLRKCADDGEASRRGTSEECSSLDDVISPPSDFVAIGDNVPCPPSRLPPPLGGDPQMNTAAADFANLDPETQERLQALLQAAGITKIIAPQDDGRSLMAGGVAGTPSSAAAAAAMFADPEVLRRLSSSVSCALDEAADHLTRMKTQPNSTVATSTTESTTTTCCSASCNGNVQLPFASGPPPLVTSSDDTAALGGIAFGYATPPTTHPLSLSAGTGAANPTVFPAATAMNVEEGESLLSLACSAGYYELAQVLLAMRTNIEDRGSKNDCTPLMEAASAGHLDIVKLLISHGADVNAQSSTGNTPLMYACAGGHKEVVDVLLDAGADVEIRNENGHCPLMEAASAGHVEIAKSLVKAGASVQSVGNGDFKVGLESPLTLASYKGHIEMVLFLLKAGPKATHRVEELHTALMEACMDGHFEVARMLIDFGAPVNLESDSFESPLTLAACGGHYILVKLLLDCGANIEDPNDEGYTPLMEAAREGHLNVVELLLDRGAQLNAHTEETGETALTLAACGGFRDVVELLVNHDADLDLGANTPLMEAAQEGHLDTVKYLIEATLAQEDLSIDATTATNDTALTYAAENGYVDVCAALLDGGTNIDHEADGGRTAMMKAAKTGHLSVVKYLVERGADVNKATAANDATSLSLACANGHIDIVKLLLDTGNADLNHKLKDSSTCIIEAAKGGHTSVVQLLLDWPGIKVPRVGGPPSLAAAALAAAHQHRATPAMPPPPPPSCAVAAAEQKKRAAAEQLSRSSPGVPGDTPPPPTAFNLPLDPQFLASVQQNSAGQPHTISSTYCQTPISSMEAAAGLSADILALDTSASGALTSHTGINSDWLLMQAQKALLKQAGEKLSESEVQQLSELLKAQFRNMFPNLPPNVSNELLSSLGSSVANAAAATATSDASGTTLKRRATGGDVTKSKEDTAKDLKLLQDAYKSQQKQAQASAQAAAIGKSVATSTTAAVGIEAVAKSAPPSEGGVPDGSTVRIDSVSVKPNDNIGRMVDSQGFKFPLPVAPSPLPQAAPPKPISVAGGIVAPQKVNAATQVGTPVVQHQQPFNNTAAVAKATSAAGTGVDLNTQTESNHDTALTLACAGGHEELVQLLLQRGADIEHRDKKGFTPLILAATAGHIGVVEVLLNHTAQIEAQSERTKDTALSLACSGGRKEVVDLLLKRGANKEHRNVSDYTPLSLAASGGYTEIVQLLLNAGAEINSRTGSKLGISPLMLAAMNGHVAATKLLLERGSDINAQIETNRNTALTLACFQGRHEVVRLLLDYRANVEHRAKTGLTPLMEAANGGYVEVGRLLLHHAADPNAPPVPSSRDTALTIAADKGHHKFVELLVQNSAQIDARNKKGCSPLWLACNGGFLETVQILVKHRADVDCFDNRKATPLMATFKKGHLKVVKYMVRHVQQFPSDQECSRFITTVTDKDLLLKCRQCMDVIVAAKDRQAQEANRAAETLLKELEKEEQLANTRKAAKQRQKEKKKAKRQAKKAAQNPSDGAEDGENGGGDSREATPRESPTPSPSPPPPAPAPPFVGKVEAPLADSDDEGDDEETPSPPSMLLNGGKKLAVSRSTQRVASPARVPAPPEEPMPQKAQPSVVTATPSTANGRRAALSNRRMEDTGRNERRSGGNRTRDRYISRRTGARGGVNNREQQQQDSTNSRRSLMQQQSQQQQEWSRAGGVRRRGGAARQQPSSGVSSAVGAQKASVSTSQQQQAVNPSAMAHPEDPYTASNRGDQNSKRRMNKLLVNSQVIARVIGRGGQNINAIREATGAHIEVEKQQQKKEPYERQITIRGALDSCRQSVLMINGLIQEPDLPVNDIIKQVQEKNQPVARNYQPSTMLKDGVTYVLSSATAASSQSATSVAGRTRDPVFPDVATWSSTSKPTGDELPVASVATATSDHHTYHTTAAPNVNVWAQRAAMRQMQQTAAAQKNELMNGQAMKRTLQSATAVSTATDPLMINTAAVTTNSETTVLADERKAPGFQRPSSRAQQSASPQQQSMKSAENGIYLGGGLSPPPQTNSAISSPAVGAAGILISGGESDFTGFTPIGLPASSRIGAVGSNRPASATPSLFSKGSNMGRVAGGDSLSPTASCEVDSTTGSKGSPPEQEVPMNEQQRQWMSINGGGGDATAAMAAMFQQEQLLAAAARANIPGASWFNAANPAVSMSNPPTGDIGGIFSLSAHLAELAMQSRDFGKSGSAQNAEGISWTTGGVPGGQNEHHPPVWSATAEDMLSNQKSTGDDCFEKIAQLICSANPRQQPPNVFQQQQFMSGYRRRDDEYSSGAPFTALRPSMHFDASAPPFQPRTGSGNGAVNSGQMPQQKQFVPPTESDDRQPPSSMFPFARPLPPSNGGGPYLHRQPPPPQQQQMFTGGVWVSDVDVQQQQQASMMMPPHLPPSGDAQQQPISFDSMPATAFGLQQPSGVAGNWSNPSWM